MPPVVLPPPSTETPSAGECKAPAADPSKPVAQKGRMENLFEDAAAPASDGENERGAKAAAAALNAEQDTEEVVAKFTLFPNGGARRSSWHARLDVEARLLVHEKPALLAQGNLPWIRKEAATSQ